MNTSSWIPILSAIVCTLACSTSLAAHTDDDVLTTTVSYADLDLSTQAGAQTLYRRIKRAARVVCALLESRELARRALWRDCHEQAVGNAVADISRGTLTALYGAARTRRG